MRKESGRRSQPMRALPMNEGNQTIIKLVRTSLAQTQYGKFTEPESELSSAPAIVYD